MQHVMSTATQQEIVDMTEIPTQWSHIRARLQSEVGEVEYRNWLRQITLGGLDGDEVVLLLPTRFLSDWVRSHYGDRLTALWRAENPMVRRVEVRVGGAPDAKGLAESLEPSHETASRVVSTIRFDEHTKHRPESA